VIYAYTGFDQAIDLAGEAKRPGRDLPIAIVGSVLIGFVVYAGVQIALIGALRPADLVHGWSELTFSGISGPLAGLATLAGMTWLAMLLYTDSVVSPSGTAIVAFAATPRLLYAVESEGLARTRFGRLSKAGVPVLAVFLTFLVAVLFLAPLPSWTAIIDVVSDSALVSYGSACVSLITLRRTAPVTDYPRPFQLEPGVFLATVGFIVTNFIIVGTGAFTVNVVSAFVLGGVALYALSETVRRRGLRHLQWRGAWWLAPYFAGLCFFADAGPPNLTGGYDILSSFGLCAWLTAFSLAILIVAVHCGLGDPREAKESLSATGLDRGSI
jgi:amino acid transporter